jgi:hypothetical protein
MGLIAVAQLYGFMLAGACSGGDSGASLGPAREGNVGFDSGISSGIKYFAGGNGYDLSHVAPMGLRPNGCCIGKTLRCGILTALLRDDAMLQAVVEFGAAIYGNRRSAAGMNGGDQFNCVLLHSLDSSKAMFARDEYTGPAQHLTSPITLVSSLDSLSAILPHSLRATL